MTFSGEAHLVDVDAADDRTSNVSSLSTCRWDFTTDVIERDRTCVMSDDIVENCDACHILPHAKGSTVRPYDSSYSGFLTLIKYMLNLVKHRGGTYGSADLDDLVDIDDTRNGLLLNVLLHRPFGASKMAFLKVCLFSFTILKLKHYIDSQLCYVCRRYSIEPTRS